MVEVYGSVGRSMGALHFVDLSPPGIGKKARQAAARTHGDANPSNLFVDGENRTTLIDNDQVNLKAILSSCFFDLGSLLPPSVLVPTFKQAGVERGKSPKGDQLTATEVRIKSEIRMFLAFGNAYLGKAHPNARALLEEDLLKTRRNYLDAYIEGLKTQGVTLGDEALKELIPEFFQDFSG